MLLFVKGQVVETIVGARTKGQIMEQLNTHLLESSN